jgi:hypothetical protein
MPRLRVWSGAILNCTYVVLQNLTDDEVDLSLFKARRIREAANAFAAYTHARAEADELGNAEVIVFSTCLAHFLSLIFVLPSMACSPQGAGIRSIAAASVELYHAAILLSAGMSHGLFGIR